MLHARQHRGSKRRVRALRFEAAGATDCGTLEDGHGGRGRGSHARIARGERLGVAGRLSSGYRAELLRLMVVFVDSEMAGAAGFADLINRAPGMRERSTAARIVSEKFAHAEAVSPS